MSELLITKRNGSREPFNSEKIVNAIKKAGYVRESTIQKIVESIKTQLSTHGSLSVEEIQDLVELGLTKSSYKKVARDYIRYRKEREMIRANEKANESILKLLDNKNEYLKTENSNKNHSIASTQRDYIAGEVSKDLSRRLLLPPEVVEAHDKGIIHFHDMDYFIQQIHNCFSGDTKFVTSKGVLTFKDCSDGQKVKVLTQNGEFAEATVRKYGKQAMQFVELTSGRTQRYIRCTPNHRWILKDGSVTTNLKVGDRLLCLPEIQKEEFKTDEYFCLGMVLADGTDHFSNEGKGHFLQIRLCGDKGKYKDAFIKCGYRESSRKEANGDVVLTKKTSITKRDFIEKHLWKLLPEEALDSLFCGFYAGDGAKGRNLIATSNKDVLEMIIDISAVAGCHITSIKELIRDTNFKKGALLYEVRFMTSQPSNRNWIVKSITKDLHGPIYDAWCVEEPTTHSFTLEGGIVTGNCCLVNLEDILQNGTVINGTLIEKPHSFSTACNIATQVAAIVASNQYGGQTMSLAHLAPFVEVSRQKIANDLRQEFLDLEDSDKEHFDWVVNQRLLDEIARGVQMIQYQINTLNSSNGQTPFITIFAYLNEAKNEQEKADLALIIKEVFKQRIQGVKNEVGEWISPAFPKIIYALEEDNIHEDSKYYWLTELAAKCTAKRLVPDYISEKKMIELKGYCFPSMGCRSFLSPWFDKDGKPKFYGRFNQGVCTINLPYIALLALKEAEDDPLTLTGRGAHIDAFWAYLTLYLDVCHKGLQNRHSRLLNTPVETSPLHWMYGALGRLPKGSNINSLLFGGYSTMSLGYAGLYECVKALTGHSHTDPEGKAFAIEILKYLNSMCDKWKKEEDIGYSLYGTPIESTTYKFANALKRDFGVIEGISDHDYITNSYHVNVREEIDPFTKLKLESEFQELSQGGCISYVETSNLQSNIPAVLEVIKFIYDNIMYAELNTKSDYCQVCGSNDEIKIVEENGKLIWECPHCGNRDQSKMNVTRRTCGLTD